MQPHRVSHLPDQKSGERMGKRLGLAMSQIQQDVGHIVGLVGQIDAGDRIGAISSSASLAASASEAVSDKV